MIIDNLDIKSQKYATPTYMRKSQAEIAYEEKHKKI